MKFAPFAMIRSKKNRLGDSSGGGPIVSDMSPKPHKPDIWVSVEMLIASTRATKYRY